MSKIIELKIKPEYFIAVAQGRKTAELRLNDRDYQVNDIMILREFDGEKYTGHSVCAKITHILSNCGFGLQDGYAMLSFKLLKKEGKKDVKKNR